MIKITLEEGKAPSCEGSPTVGQVIEIARQLEKWALQIKVAEKQTGDKNDGTN